MGVCLSKLEDFKVEDSDCYPKKDGEGKLIRRQLERMVSKILFGGDDIAKYKSVIKDLNINVSETQEGSESAESASFTKDMNSTHVSHVDTNTKFRLMTFRKKGSVYSSSEACTEGQKQDLDQSFLGQDRELDDSEIGLPRTSFMESRKLMKSISSIANHRRAFTTRISSKIKGK